MGSFAGLLREAGHRVTGSDVAFYPPMGDALKDWGIELCEGFRPEHLASRPDLVVIGNVCRRDNVEARAAIDQGLPYDSFPGAMERLFLRDRQPFVIAGTHGKTTTTALLAHLLSDADAKPGYLIGGIPHDLPSSHAIGEVGQPFVIEGDEYDCAFFEKKPKFWRYRPWAAALTSIEHDHIDIYPDEASYVGAFEGFIDRIPADGWLAAHTANPSVANAVRSARCQVLRYGLRQDVEHPEEELDWLAEPLVVAADHGLREATAGSASPMQHFRLLVRGAPPVEAKLQLSGAHNLRNAVAALALAHVAAGRSLGSMLERLATFRGVRRRQELVTESAGVRLYDDFAHHPTAVRETLDGLKDRHPGGRLWAVFEPRSATASRRLHQAGYGPAFAAADAVVLAPVGRSEIPEPERLDVQRIAAELRARGKDAHAPANADDILDLLLDRVQDGDTIVLMSNGAFGGLRDRLADGLSARAAV